MDWRIQSSVRRPSPPRVAVPCGRVGDGLPRRGVEGKPRAGVLRGCGREGRPRILGGHGSRVPRGGYPRRVQDQSRPCRTDLPDDGVGEGHDAAQHQRMLPLPTQVRAAAHGSGASLLRLRQEPGACLGQRQVYRVPPGFLDAVRACNSRRRAQARHERNRAGRSERAKRRIRRARSVRSDHTIHIRIDRRHRWASRSALPGKRHL